MKDYNSLFIKSVEQRLSTLFDSDQISDIVNILVVSLSDFDIMEKNTDLVSLDSTNEMLLKNYCACMAINGLSKNTINQYSFVLSKVSDYIKKPFTEMTTYDIRYFLAIEKQRGIANTTLEANRAILSALFTWMVNEDLIAKNPMQSIKPIKHPTKTRKPFTEIEIDALRSSCQTLKQRALIETLLSSGVRVEELSNLYIDDIDFVQTSVDVRHGKGDKERITYLSTIAVKYLTKYLSERKHPNVYLFTNKNNERLRPSGIAKILKTIGDRAGVQNVYPHRFRITFATNLAARGMDVQEIQKLLGHSSVETTMIYIHTNDTQVKNSYKKYSA